MSDMSPEARLHIIKGLAAELQEKDDIIKTLRGNTTRPTMKRCVKCGYTFSICPLCDHELEDWPPKHE